MSSNSAKVPEQVQDLETFYDRISAKDHELSIGDQREYSTLSQEIQTVLNDDNTSLRVYKKANALLRQINEVFRTAQ